MPADASANSRAGRGRLPDASEGQSALALLEEGAGLFRRTFRNDAWIYYASSAPVAVVSFAIFQRTRAIRLDSAELLAYALLWTLAYAVRVWGTAAYGRRLQTFLGADPAPAGGRAAAARGVSALRGRALLLWLWVMAAPFGAGPWVYTAAQFLPLATEAEADGRPVRNALRLARGWIGTQWSMLLISALLWIVLLINLTIAVWVLPAIAHALLGIQSSLARAGAMATTSQDAAFWMALLMATYLGFDPVVKCAYGIAYFRRCARSNGAELWARLRILRQAARDNESSLAGVRTALPAAAPIGGVSAARMGAALEAELRQPQYAWRQGVHVAPPTWMTPIDRFFDVLAHPFVALFHWIGRELGRAMDWLTRHLGGQFSPGAARPGHSDWQTAAWIAVAALAGIIVWQGVAIYRRRRATVQVATPPPSPAISLDDATGAEREENEWFVLAQSLLAGGELRAAFRAAFLAGLSGLGARQLLTLRRDRTNREYFDEFRRRAAPLGHAETGDAATARFREGIRTFNEVWYGERAVNGELVRDFIAAQRELLNCV